MLKPDDPQGQNRLLLAVQKEEITSSVLTWNGHQDMKGKEQVQKSRGAETAPHLQMKRGGGGEAYAVTCALSWLGRFGTEAEEMKPWLHLGRGLERLGAGKGEAGFALPTLWCLVFMLGLVYPS